MVVLDSWWELVRYGKDKENYDRDRDINDVNYFPSRFFTEMSHIVAVRMC